MQSLLSDKMFNFYFVHTTNNLFKYSKYPTKLKFPTNIVNNTNKLNISKLWVIKYNKFIILQVFCFFLKKSKTHTFLKKNINILSIVRQKKYKKIKNLKKF